MPSDRTIGRAVKVKTYQVLVELLPETSSYVKSGLGGLYSIAVINSFVIVPVGSERVVAIVTSLDMAEEAEASMHSRQMLVIARPRRTIWASMIGTLTQSARGIRFEYGVKRYPELDNPVWFASEEDLDVIFDKAGKNNPHHVTIGKSPIFTDYEVNIDIDKFFGKHAAILGNTGAGKSCTVTAMVRAVLDRGMPNAHFIIFDTNNEYEHAFTLADGKPLYDRLVLRNDGDTPTGLHIPHWFMNSVDYQAFFRPGEGAQAPLLFTAISAARAAGRPGGSWTRLLNTIEDTMNQIEGILQNTGSAAFYGKRNVRDQVGSLRRLLVAKEEANPQSVGGLSNYIDACDQFNPSCMGDGGIDAVGNNAIRELIQSVRESLTTDRAAAIDQDGIQAGVDSPTHFSFEEFVGSIFPEVLGREAQKNANIRSYAGTLQLRLEQARQDPRYAFLFQVPPFAQALASSGYSLGLDPICISRAILLHGRIHMTTNTQRVRSLTRSLS